VVEDEGRMAEEPCKGYTIDYEAFKIEDKKRI
jgi:hypothetical protein